MKICSINGINFLIILPHAKIMAIGIFFFNYNTEYRDISKNDYTLGRKRNISRVTRTRSYAPSAISYSLLIESDNCIRAESEVMFHQP